MKLHQDFKMMKQVLIEQQWMFDEIQFSFPLLLYFINHPSLFYHHLKVLMKLHKNQNILTLSFLHNNFITFGLLCCSIYTYIFVKKNWSDLKFFLHISSEDCIFFKCMKLLVIKLFWRSKKTHFRFYLVLQVSILSSYLV